MEISSVFIIFLTKNCFNQKPNVKKIDSAA
jgi:hypothetical protein